MVWFKRKSKETVEEVVTEETASFDNEKPNNFLKVKIFCVGGFSTSLWALNVTKEMQKQNFSGEVTAYPVSDAKNEGGDADIILLGPQTRYLLGEVETNFADKKVSVVPFEIFGQANGEKGLAYIKTLL